MTELAPTADGVLVVYHVRRSYKSDMGYPSQRDSGEWYCTKNLCTYIHIPQATKKPGRARGKWSPQT